MGWEDWVVVGAALRLGQSGDSWKARCGDAGDVDVSDIGDCAGFDGSVMVDIELA